MFNVVIVSSYILRWNVFDEKELMFRIIRIYCDSIYSDISWGCFIKIKKNICIYKLFLKIDNISLMYCLIDDGFCKFCFLL